MITRRRFLRTAGVAAAATALPPIGATSWGRAQAAEAQVEEVVITATIVAADFIRYRYFPFEVPPGVNRLEASIDKGGLSLGFGVFDERGPEYQSPGFRGVLGSETDEFFISANEASLSFTPGPIRPGTWTLVVPGFSPAPAPTEVTMRVLLSFGPAGHALGPGPEVGVVSARRGWYRGDLHCHTSHSSDARSSGSSLLPREWAERCREVGLDYASMTDHNVVSQNFALAADAGRDVLLMPGEEMTNWFHGHATVSGIEADQWLDWRQRPLGFELGPYERRIQDFMAEARKLGGYVSAAHPVFVVPTLNWSFFPDSDADEAALPDGIEVWTGPFFSQPAVDRWDQELRRGRVVWANGGSDLHGTVNDFGFEAGEPTTVIYAPRLSKRALVDAQRRGRSFITRAPDGAELYLTATGPRSQATFVGGTIYGEPSAAAPVEVLVRRGPLVADDPLEVVVLRDGVALSRTEITEDDQVVRSEVPIGSGGYVRAELRQIVADRPGTGPMEALTNPIFLVPGDVPRGRRREFAPPPRRRPDLRPWRQPRRPRR